MKHVEICEGAPQRFRVFCDTRRTYVLNNVTREQVREYFVGIATDRARDAAEALMQRAEQAGPVLEDRPVH